MRRNIYLSLSAGILVTSLSIGSNAKAEVIYGMGSHVGQGRTTPQQLWSWLNDSNFKGTRDEVYWGDVEKEPGIFSFTKRARASLDMINKSSKMGLKPLVVLDYGNRLYDDGDLPYTDKGRVAFARYSNFIASNVAPEVNLFEIWNEWNIGMGSKPRRRYGSPLDYVKLTAAAAKAVRTAKPDATIIGGSLADDLGGWPWLQQAIGFGLLDHVDGVSVHLYNYLNRIENGGDQEFIDRLRQLELILQKARPKNPPHIYVTEIGWPNHQGRGSVPNDMAAYMATRFLFHSREIKSLRGIWFYELLDGGTDPEEKEHHFGALTHSGIDKPISCAFKTVGQFIDSLTLLSAVSKNGLRIQTNKTATGTYITALWQEKWNLERPAVVRITSKDQIDEIDLDCDQKRFATKNSMMRLNVSHKPVILKHAQPIDSITITY